MKKVKSKRKVNSSSDVQVPICKNCFEHYLIDYYPNQPTVYCHNCAQVLVEKYEDAIGELKNTLIWTGAAKEYLEPALQTIIYKGNHRGYFVNESLENLIWALTKFMEKTKS